MYSQQELATIAIKNKLFVVDWNISNHYEDIVNNKHRSYYLISVLFQEDIPVAAATIHKTEKHLNVYVNPEYRGYNYGLQVIEQILKENSFNKNEVYALLGEDGTHEFYKKAGIACFDDDIPMNHQEIQDFIHHRISYQELVKNKIQQKLNDYENNVSITYEKKYPRSVVKLKCA